MIRKLSIIVPAYNEDATISQILLKISKVKFAFEYEVIVVDDGSKDATRELATKFTRRNHKFRVIEHEKNLGKGQAVKTGLEYATGDYVIIQDADLEYNPQDIIRLVESVSKEFAVIYGSRLLAPPVFWGENKTPLISHYFGNKFLSLITSLLYGSWLTDMETCYKLFPRKAVLKMKLKSRGFEFEPEITAKLLKLGYKVKEISIKTVPRDFSQGKKIDTIKDGTRALLALFKYRFLD
jgi:glycosyltransferase involved in cell wall biosynthesis